LRDVLPLVYDGVARPTALTPKLRERIELDLEDGISFVVVAQNVGVGRSTLHGWISSGRVSRRRRRDPLTLVPESPAEDDRDPSLEDALVTSFGGRVG
jgi:hypothetical protein